MHAITSYRGNRPTHPQTNRQDGPITIHCAAACAQCNKKVNDEAEVTCSGSVFQMRVPAAGKAREVMEVSRTAGTISSSKVEDRSLWREGTLATRTNCRRYCGTSPVGQSTVRQDGKRVARAKQSKMWVQAMSPRCP